MENTNNVVNKENQEKDVEVKTFTQEEVNELLKGYKTQEEVDRIVAKRLQRATKDIEARVEAERKEAEELAKLSEQEKSKRILEKRIADLEAREKQIAKKELENEASKQLRELGISIDATRFVMGKDAETTHDNIKDFALLVESLKEDVKKDLLRGKTPKVPTQASKGITKEEWNKMNLVQRQQIFNSNRELYNELNK